MSKQYLLSIKPINDYFFGVENKNNDGSDNYFLRSSNLPQASTILGAIRYLLLLNAEKETFSNNQIIDKAKAGELIGENSFDTADTTFAFGKLLSVSNVFILQNNHTKLLPVPNWLDTQGKELIYYTNIKASILPEYSSKNEHSKQFTDGTTETESAVIFKELIQITNRKNNKEEKGKDAFFKTQTYKLNDGYSFGVEITVTDDIVLKNTLMKIGGENKLFSIEIIENTTLKTNQEIYLNYRHPSLYKLILISDGYLKSISKNYLFAYTTHKTFRYLKSTIATTKNYSSVSKDDVSRSETLLNLLENGAVFYFNDEKAATNFQEQFTNDNLQNAGFNQTILLTPKIKS